MSRQKQVPEFDIWACLLCPVDAEGYHLTFETFAEFKEHLTDAHVELLDGGELAMPMRRRVMCHWNLRHCHVIDSVYRLPDGRELCGRKQQTARDKSHGYPF